MINFNNNHGSPIPNIDPNAPNTPWLLRHHGFDLGQENVNPQLVGRNLFLDDYYVDESIDYKNKLACLSITEASSPSPETYWYDEVFRPNALFPNNNESTLRHKVTRSSIPPKARFPSDKE